MVTITQLYQFTTPIGSTVLSAFIPLKQYASSKWLCASNVPHLNCQTWTVTKLAYLLMQFKFRLNHLVPSSLDLGNLLNQSTDKSRSCTTNMLSINWPCNNDVSDQWKSMHVHIPIKFTNDEHSIILRNKCDIQISWHIIGYKSRPDNLAYNYFHCFGLQNQVSEKSWFQWNFESAKKYQTYRRLPGLM